jgi:transcriptional regulator with XRE-family HTH domain
VTPWALEERKLRRQLARNIRAIRQERHLSVEEVAHDAAMHWRHWQKVEAGEVGVTLKTIAKIAVGLDVDACTLLR